jgi:hypothetical protein
MKLLEGFYLTPCCNRIWAISTFTHPIILMMLVFNFLSMYMCRKFLSFFLFIPHITSSAAAVAWEEISLYLTHVCVCVCPEIAKPKFLRWCNYFFASYHPLFFVLFPHHVILPTILLHCHYLCRSVYSFVCVWFRNEMAFAADIIKLLRLIHSALENILPPLS